MRKAYFLIITAIIITVLAQTVSAQFISVGGEIELENRTPHVLGELLITSNLGVLLDLGIQTPSYTVGVYGIYYLGDPEGLASLHLGVGSRVILTDGSLARPRAAFLGGLSLNLSPIELPAKLRLSGYAFATLPKLSFWTYGIRLGLLLKLK